MNVLLFNRTLFKEHTFQYILKALFFLQAHGSLFAIKYVLNFFFSVD